MIAILPFAQDNAVRAQAPKANGKLKATPKTAGVMATVKLYDAGGNVFLTAMKKVTQKTNAFDFLRGTLAVDFTTFPPNLTAPKPFPGGPFVNALAGVPPDSGTYWALYVDRKYSCVGIGAITIEANDVLIEWKMEGFDIKHPECE
jgi:hypothetical protein